MSQLSLSLSNQRLLRLNFFHLFWFSLSKSALVSSLYIDNLFATIQTRHASISITFFFCHCIKEIDYILLNTQHIYYVYIEMYQLSKSSGRHVYTIDLDMQRTYRSLDVNCTFCLFFKLIKRTNLVIERKEEKHQRSKIEKEYVLVWQSVCFFFEWVLEACTYTLSLFF